MKTVRRCHYCAGPLIRGSGRRTWHGIGNSYAQPVVSGSRHAAYAGQGQSRARAAHGNADQHGTEHILDQLADRYRLQAEYHDQRDNTHGPDVTAPHHH